MSAEGEPIIESHELLRKRVFFIFRPKYTTNHSCIFWRLSQIELIVPQAAQTFAIYIRDSIALRFEPFKRMYESGSKIALNSTCNKGLNERSLP